MRWLFQFQTRHQQLRDLARAKEIAWEAMELVQQQRAEIKQLRTEKAALERELGRRA